MINFMMEDCVIYMAEESLQNYVDFVVSRCQYAVEVKSLSEVLRIPTSDAAIKCAHLPPLFSCKLVAKQDEGIQYNTPPRAFIDAAIASFSTASGVVQDIPQLEKFVMEGLFWSSTPVLQTISAHEGLAKELLEALTKILESVLPCMDEYLALYEPYNEAVMLDLEKFVAEYKEKDKSIQEMQQDVKKENKKIDEIELDFPTSISVGVFIIDTMAVRKALIEKHQAISNAMLSLIATKVKERGVQVSDAFQVIQRSLARPFEDVEQVAELEEYVQNLGTELSEIQEILDTMVMEKVVLEDCYYTTSD